MSAWPSLRKRLIHHHFRASWALLRGPGCRCGCGPANAGLAGWRGSAPGVYFARLYPDPRVPMSDLPVSLSSAVPLAGARAEGEAEMTTGTQRAGLAAARVGAGGVRQRLRDYVTLTKPRIISLLLVTTVVPMVIAARGWPALDAVLWTML